MPKYRSQSRRWLRANPKGKTSYTGLQDWWLGVPANKRVNEASRHHDADYTNYAHPYTTTQAADERWIRRIGDDASIPAVLGKAIFSAKGALLPRSRRSWGTKVTAVRRTTGPQPPTAQPTPQPLRAPTVTHGTNNQSVMPKRGYSGPQGGVKKYAKYVRPKGALYGASYGPITKSDHQALQALKREFKRDIKNIDTLVPNPTQIPNTGYFLSPLADIAQGDKSVGNRLGSSVDIKTVSIHLQLDADDNVAAKPCQPVRCCLVLDKQANGKVPITDWTTDTLFEVTVGSAATDRFRNLSETGRFSILWDRHIMLNKDPGSGKQCARVHKSVNFKKPLRVEYEKGTTSGAASTIKDNNLWLLVLGDEATTYAPQVQGTMRVRYHG